MALLSLALVLVLLPFLCAATAVFSSSHTHTPEKVVCIEEERQALLTFKDGLSSPNSSLLLSSWVGDDCCNWIGVGCNNNTGHVVRLDLRNASIHVLDSGELNPSLLELNHLEYLDLSTNSFGHRSIPKFFGSFKNLTYLNLSCACFIGAVPSELGNLSRLQHLDLSSFPWFPCVNWVNYLNVNNLDWVSHLSSLKYLDMSNVNLSRANDWFQITNLLPSVSALSLQHCSLMNLPILTHPNLTTLTYLDLSFNHIASKFPAWLVNLTDLEFLDLSNNSFEGPLPDSFINLSNLEYLNLASNNFSGTVSESVGQLSKLENLGLHYNSLEGVIHEAHFANLTRLRVLALSYNSLVFNVSQNWIPPPKLNFIGLASCRLGPKFPRWLLFLKDYSFIDLSNTQISDVMPTWFWNLSSKAFTMNLYSNNISGKIPTSLEFYIGRTIILDSNRFEGVLPFHVSNARIMSGVDDSITSLYASNNSLSGSIPSSLCDIQSLYGLDLSNNQITGQIPSCFGNFSNLQLLDLSNNILEGEIPSSIAKLRFLTILNLSNNSLVGIIPRRFESLSLVYLILNHNHLHGLLPLSFANSTNLVAIDLSKNRLSGSLTTWMWESLTQLRFLNLRSNMFHGNIPLQLSILVSLQVLDLADNQLSGVIPSSFSNFTAMARTHNLNEDVIMQWIEHASNHLELSVIMKRIELEFTRTIGLLNYMDLSGNGLSGEIPKGLVRLIGLKSLNLSGNHLEGSIPKDIGDLQQLESLDFSRNLLSGTIPLSISMLNFLSSLNLSYNNLSGHIPSGRQLQTFIDPSIYMGNYNLCGPPLSDCPDELSHTSMTSNGGEEEDRSELLWFFIGATMGFVIGFWSVYGILLLNKSWRIAYYGFFDKLIDRLNFHFVNIILKLG